MVNLSPNYKSTQPILHSRILSTEPIVSVVEPSKQTYIIRHIRKKLASSKDKPLATQFPYVWQAHSS